MPCAPMQCNRRALAAIAAITAMAGAGAAAQDDDSYIDDRSGPARVITSYYNAINAQDYVRAYSYYSEGWAPKDYYTWAKGFETTAHVTLRTGPTQGDPGAGNVYWALPVAISARQTDGTVTVYAGCYTIHGLNGPQSDPPFVPLGINKGTLKPSDKPLDAALPASCDGFD